MSRLEELYEARSQPGVSNISDLLPVLRYFASKSASVVELGVETGNSTVALLMGQPELMLSIDIMRREELDQIVGALAENQWPTKWTFHLGSDLDIEIPECDLLFIDSEHTEQQLENELRLHADRTKKWIAFHDTEYFKETDFVRPIERLLRRSPEWSVAMHVRTNNGLTVLERTE